VKSQFGDSMLSGRNIKYFLQFAIKSMTRKAPT